MARYANVPKKNITSNAVTARDAVPQPIKGVEELTIECLPKAWGQEEIVVNAAEAGYCGKILHLRAGWRSSLHRHACKDETFFCVKGRVVLEWFDAADERHELMLDGDFRPAVRIHPGTWHRFYAVADPTDPGIVASVVEFSTPHADSDVERRANTERLTERPFGYAQ